MKSKDLSTKNHEELKALLQAERERLFGFKMKQHESRLKNVKMLRESRKTIARILTILNKTK